MTARRLLILLGLVVVMGTTLVLFRAETRRLGRDLVQARRARDALVVQYDRLRCQQSTFRAPDVVEARAMAMGLQLVMPGADPNLMYAQAGGGAMSSGAPQEN